MDLVTYVEHIFLTKTGSKRDLALLEVEPAFQFTLEQRETLAKDGERDE